MEKGPSTYAEYWTSPYNEVEHFGRHGWQIGFEDNLQGYSQAAKDLALSEDNETILLIAATTMKVIRATKAK